MKGKVEEDDLVAFCKMLSKRHIRKFITPPPLMFILGSSVIRNCFKLVPG